jgi:hypothetical protein
MMEEAYKKYMNNWDKELPRIGPCTQEEFINKIKTDDVFAKKWGVKVEVRELSLEERYSIMQSSIRTATLGKPTMCNHEYYDSKKIPKRSISLTYNNQTEVIYE